MVLVRRLAPMGAVFAVGVLALAPTMSCDVPPLDQTTYYERTILPILNVSCGRTNTSVGCHISDPKGNAFGNLDVTTYDEISKRRDLLDNYGPYGRPALLVKNIPPFQVTVKTFDNDETNPTPLTNIPLTTDIKHTGGPILDPTATAYLTLSQWMTTARRRTTPAFPRRLRPFAVHRHVPPADPAAASTRRPIPRTPTYAQFVSNVIPIMQGTGTGQRKCGGKLPRHARSTSSTSRAATRPRRSAGTTSPRSSSSRRPRARASPAAAARTRRRAARSTRAESSCRPRATRTTRTSSTGRRAQRPRRSDGDARPSTAEGSPSFMFFVHRVQPMLVKKGCMMLQCHSAAMFHEYRLRGGTGGIVLAAATQKNYASRSRNSGSTATTSTRAASCRRTSTARTSTRQRWRHRAPRRAALRGLRPGTDGVDGASLQRFEASGAMLRRPRHRRTTTTWTPSTRSRVLHGPRVAPAGAGARGEVQRRAVQRRAAQRHRVRAAGRTPRARTSATDFDVFAGGASIHILAATLNAAGSRGPGRGHGRDGGCGLSRATADIRGRAVSWDGKKVAFAARHGCATTPFLIYDDVPRRDELQLSTGTANHQRGHGHEQRPARPQLRSAVRAARWQRRHALVFASTRGVDPARPTRRTSATCGTQRQPFDPTKPNPNLYVYEPDPNNAREVPHPPAHVPAEHGALAELHERRPHHLQRGQARAELLRDRPSPQEPRRRRLPSALRRSAASIGMLRGDAGRRSSPNKNFATIFSDPGWHHQGGVLGVFNRSIGIDFYSTNKTDYPIDPTVFDPSSPSSPEPAVLPALARLRRRQRRVHHRERHAHRNAAVRATRRAASTVRPRRCRTGRSS